MKGGIALIQEERIEKKKEAFKKDKSYISYGSQYFDKQLRNIEEKLDILSSNPTKYFSRKFTESEVLREEKKLEQQIKTIQEKQKDYEKHRTEVDKNFTEYEDVLQAKASYNDKQVGDENLMKDIHSIRGDQNNQQLIKIYRNELMKVREILGKARDSFSSSVDKNLKYLIDNKGEQILDPLSDLTKSEFIDMLEAENRNRENHPPLETAYKDLVEEQKAILYHNHPEQARIDTVLDKNNNFNFSARDIKNINKCTKLYEAIAKQEQLISKIGTLLKRFEGREEDFPKSYKKLEKMRVKAEKTLIKLGKKVEKPYKESRVEDLHNLVVARKEVEEKREDISIQKQELENAKNLKIRLEAEKIKIDEKIKSEKEITERAEIDESGVQIQETRPDISALIEQSKQLEEKLSSLSFQIVNGERNMSTEKAQLQQMQVNAAKLGVGLERFTTKAVTPVKSETIISDNRENLLNRNSGHKNFAESIKVTVNEKAIQGKEKKEQLTRETQLSEKDSSKEDFEK